MIKICRGNAMLPWITKNFHFKYKPVYMVRHPFAVVASQLRHGSWDHFPNRFEVPRCPFSDFYSLHESFLKTLNSREEVLTALWCLTNSVPMSHSGNNHDWVTIYYEHLLINPEKELNRIFEIWDIEFPDSIKRNIDVQSKTTRPDQFEEDKMKQLKKWKVYFSVEQLNSMYLVIDYFKIHKYNYESYLPIDFN